ncbi:MAG: hypothetical protein H7A55_09335 [Verrucomicrobiaceae bacterium]|nr:hypothetical protein [Verrucomicrobiaceae bacterium]
MDAFFNTLGDSVLVAWKRENFSLESFPGIACAALEALPPAVHVDLAAFMREFLLNDAQPQQSMSGFGQPELVAYHHPRFYIQLLFWLDGTTDIHQHEFSGAFHVMTGSSIHALYDFEKARSITPHFRVGEVTMQEIELLETGRTVPIVSGQRCIHSLFHLDTPSVTVVVRTQHDPGTGPQFNYLPPHVAMDPVFNDELTVRRKQLLDVLEQIEDPSYAELAQQMIADLDFERGFFILQHCMGTLQNLGEWEAVLAGFEGKHGLLAVGIGATLAEGLRRQIIKDMRGCVTDPEHRFFIALLMNVPTRKDLFALTKQRFPEATPEATLCRWVEELMVDTDAGIASLDACFPADVEIDAEDQAEIFMAAFLHWMKGGKRIPAALRKCSAADLRELNTSFAGSSLRILAA